MTMALALQFTREWFREKYGWKANECGVEFNSLPAYDSGNFFVSIDDGGVSTGQQGTDSLKEVLSINIGIWKRKEHFQKDGIGELKMPEDKYLANNWTLHKLERRVIVAKAGFFGLHQNWEFREALNNRYALPHADYGADFKFPFYYQGRGGMINQVVSVESRSGTSYIEFYGYILRFSGLAREQIVHNASSSLG